MQRQKTGWYITSMFRGRSNRAEFQKPVQLELSRPIRMLATELIVSTVTAYLSLVYAIFYMSFEIYPSVFQGVFRLSPGITGLCYLPISGGALLSLSVFWLWDRYLQRSRSRGLRWAYRRELRRLPLAVLGGPVFAISLFWLGFTSRTSNSFVVPLLSGLPFGLGFMLIFMALINYLSDAYGIFTASASAAALSSRSLVATVLPFATGPMFVKLGITGACALLGGLSFAMSVIPVFLIWKGPEIRERSPFCLGLEAENGVGPVEEV